MSRSNLNMQKTGNYSLHVDSRGIGGIRTRDHGLLCHMTSSAIFMASRNVWPYHSNSSIMQKIHKKIMQIHDKSI